MYRDKMNLSKRGRLLILTGFTILLYGTSLFQQKMPEGKAVLVTSDFVREKPNKITFSTETYEKSFYNTKNELCLSLVYRYPLIREEGKVNLKAINQQIEQQRDKWIASQQDLIDTAKEQDLICNTNGNEVNYRITLNENDILSILFEGYLYAGGAHGMPYRMPQTFRVSTGKPMSLTELTGLTKDQVKAKVNKQFTTLYNESPEMFWENAKELVQNLSYDNYSYYVEKDGVHIFFDPYFVAPFAAGFIELIL